MGRKIALLIVLCILIPSVYAAMDSKEFHDNVNIILEKHFRDIEHSGLTIAEGKDLLALNLATRKFNSIDLSGIGGNSGERMDYIYKKGYDWAIKESLSPPRSLIKNLMLPALVIALCVVIIAFVVVLVKKQRLEGVLDGPSEETNDKLKAYIVKEIEGGFSREQITKSLLSAGWKQEDIEAEFSSLRRQ